MSTATVTSKGRNHPGRRAPIARIEAGDRVEFVQIEPGRFELVPATGSVRELKGMFGKAQRRVSIKEMNAAIAARGAAARWFAVS